MEKTRTRTKLERTPGTKTVMDESVLRWCDSSWASSITRSAVCSSVGWYVHAGVGGAAKERPPKSLDQSDVLRPLLPPLGDPAGAADLFFERMSSRKPEKMTMPPAPSGPKSYENVLWASGSSTTIREYGRPVMVCDGVGQLLRISWCTYSAAWLRGRRGYSAGGGSGTSPSPHSSQTGARDLLSPSFGITASRLEGVPNPSVASVRGWYDFGGTVLGDDLGDGLIPACAQRHCRSLPQPPPAIHHHNSMNIVSQPPTPVRRATDPLPMAIPPPQVLIPMHKQRKGWHNRRKCIFLLPPFFLFLFSFAP